MKTSYCTSTESERGAYWSEYEMCLKKALLFSETHEHPRCEYLFCHIQLVASRWYIMLYWYGSKSGDTGWHVCHLSTSGLELSASCLQRQRPQHERPVYKDNKKGPYMMTGCLFFSCLNWGGGKNNVFLVICLSFFFNRLKRSKKTPWNLSFWFETLCWYYFWFIFL